MAHLKKNILGNFSGKIGNISSRIQKGNTIFSSLPDNFSKPMDENSILRRNKFKTSIKMNSAIFSSDILKSLWTELTPVSMNYRNYLMKQNYKSLDNSNIITEATQLTPFVGTRFDFADFVLNDTNVKFDLDLNSFAFKNDRLVISFILFQFTSKVNDSLEDFSFALIESKALQYSETNLYSFEVPLTDEAYAYNRFYNSKNILLSVITLNSEGAIANFSSSKLISL